MAIFKSLGPDDVSRIPFNANKKFSYTFSQFSTVGITAESASYVRQNLNTFSSASTDTANTLKHYQLDHLFYKNHKRKVADKFGDNDYLNQIRSLHEKVIIYNIPSNLYGNKILPGSFEIKTPVAALDLIDDGNGNLLVSSAFSDPSFWAHSHSIDLETQVFHMGPIEGYKKYDVNYNLYGKTTPNPDKYYNKNKVYDDSYYFNLLDYKNIQFANIQLPFVSESAAHFNNNSSNRGYTASIVAPHHENYNFGTNDDFTITFSILPALGSTDSQESDYIVSKSTTKTIIKSPINVQTYTTGSSQPVDVKDVDSYPFEVFMKKTGTERNIHFRRSDGDIVSEISCSITTGSRATITCMRSASRLEIYNNGVLQVSSSDNTVGNTKNNSNLYIGSKGEIGNYFTGSLSRLHIFNSSRTNEQIKQFQIASPSYIGNIFYSQGIIAITHPNYTFQGNTYIQNVTAVNFKGVNPIYENEYMCTVKADEYNYTHNISIRKIQSDQTAELANFATGSVWKPYVTTIGLYNEEGELLVIGKLGQPVRISDETDTTFVLKWDT